MRIRTKIRIFQAFTALLMCVLDYKLALGLSQPRWGLVIGLSIVCSGWIGILESILRISEPSE